MDILLASEQTLRSIDGLEKYINGLDMIPATGLYRNKVLLALLSKALTVSRAVCVLVDAGFPAEAFGLSRTLVEIYFNVRYIANKETETRAKTYVNYWSKVHESWIDIQAKHFPNVKHELPSFHDEAMSMSEDFPSKYQWTGTGGQTKVMATEEDMTELDDEGKPLRVDFDYDAIYFWTSHFVHATVIALEAHGAEHREIFRVWSRRKEDEKFRGKALFNVLVFLSKAFVCACRVMCEEQPAVLEEMGTIMSSCADAAERNRALRQSERCLSKDPS
jgi:hypothetical protein